MGLFRLIFLGLIAWAIYRFIRILIPPASETPASTPQPGTARRKTPVDTMVRCAQCGLHIPQDEAVRDGDKYFCSIEHRDRHRRA